MIRAPALLFLLLAPLAGHALEFKNILFPFSSDGCSNFPDGIPYYNDSLWLRCCVEHDLKYWEGGTADQRINADNELFQCVKNASGSEALANSVYYGVRAGGYPHLPTSTGWGKGWALPRGYTPLTAEEKSQVKALKPILPEKIEDFPLEFRPTVRPRFFVSNDHCFDIAALNIQQFLERPFQLGKYSRERWENGQGHHLRLKIQVDGCEEPFEFQFLLLRRTACTDEMNEIVARGRIRLVDGTLPNTCRPDSRP